MKKLPTSIQLYGQHITVIHVPNMVELGDKFGDWDMKTNTIRVQETGHGIPDDICFQSFIHEQVHAILDLSGLTELSSDERAVEQLGQCIYQAEKTRRYS